VEAGAHPDTLGMLQSHLLTPFNRPVPLISWTRSYVASQRPKVKQTGLIPNKQLASKPSDSLSVEPGMAPLSLDVGIAPESSDEDELCEVLRPSTISIEKGPCIASSAWISSLTMGSMVPKASWASTNYHNDSTAAKTSLHMYVCPPPSPPEGTVTGEPPPSLNPSTPSSLTGLILMYEPMLNHSGPCLH